MQNQVLPSNLTPEDALVLGRTQEQRGSEIQSGARAELIPSPLTLALSSMRGRIVAQTMLYMVNSKGAVNFTAARVILLKECIKRSIPATALHPVLVELAVGFSPVSIWLAEELPRATMIEIDIPFVLTRRQ